jgi:hypothetical protein
MSNPARAFGVLLALAWAVLAAITFVALVELGPRAAVRTFIGDFAHPWRAQFYTDFSLHLVLTAAWVLYRARTPALGAAFGFLVLSLGALFTIPYVIAAAIRAKGDARTLLLGRHA